MSYSKAVERYGSMWTDSRIRYWKPIGESANEVVAKLCASQERLGQDFEEVLYGNLWDLYEDSSSPKLDTDWITEYLALYDAREDAVNVGCDF